MNVATVIDRHVTGTYSVIRASTPTFTSGMQDARVKSTVLIDAHVQPASGDDIAIVAEMKTVKRVKTVWTRSELFVGGQGEEPDRIVIDGEEYEVMHLETWGELGEFYKALVGLL